MALASLRRHPDVVELAQCMCGTYDLAKCIEVEPNSDHDYNTPTRFLPGLPDGAHLAQLRKRFVLLTHGKGKAEEPEQSWNVARVLGSRNIPNRVVECGEQWPDDGPT